VRPEGSGADVACDVSSAGVNSVILTVRRVRVESSRSRSGSTGGYYGENDG
jgi:hypothetical protein